jgi:transcriptional regulator with XRE-family HTH domain
LSNARKWNEILRYEREVRNWTQAQVAHALQIDPKRVSAWEVGTTKPGYKNRKKLLKLFSKTAQEFGFLAQEFSDESSDNDNSPEEDSDELDSPKSGGEEVSPSPAAEVSPATEQAQPIQLLVPRTSLVTVQIRYSSISTSSAKDGMISIEEKSTLPVFGSESSVYMDYQRREFLHILGMASSALLFTFPLDWERMSDAIEKPSRLDGSVIESFEALNKHLWTLYLSAATKSLVLDGVLGQFKMLAQLLKEPHSSHIHQCLCALSSDLSQLAGEIFFDRHEHETAKACYQFAMTTAKEAKSPDLWASAVVRSAFLPLYEEEYAEALTLLKEAGRVAQHGDSALSTQFWAAAVEAEAASGTGNLAAC